MNATSLTSTDALIVVDVQNDFLPSGSVPVPQGDEVIPALNRVIASFSKQSLPIIATRDWHPPNHCSFKAQGGTWPPHCIAESEGAAFANSLNLPATAVIVSKATAPDKDAYSGFEGTQLAELLRAQQIKRLFVGGLATDYCVLNTVRDALTQGFEVALLSDAIRAVNLQAGDGQAAIDEMVKSGAKPYQSSEI